MKPTKANAKTIAGKLSPDLAGLVANMRDGARWQRSNTTDARTLRIHWADIAQLDELGVLHIDKPDGVHVFATLNELGELVAAEVAQ